MIAINVEKARKHKNDDVKKIIKSKSKEYSNKTGLSGIVLDLNISGEDMFDIAYTKQQKCNEVK